MMQGSLPTRLRVLRAERGLTLREAAALTDVRPGTLSELERGVRHPHDVTLSRIAKGYGVPVEDLLEEPVPLAEAPPGEPASGQGEVHGRALVHRVGALALGSVAADALRPVLRDQEEWSRDLGERIRTADDHFAALKVVVEESKRLENDFDQAVDALPMLRKELLAKLGFPADGPAPEPGTREAAKRAVRGHPAGEEKADSAVRAFVDELRASLDAEYGRKGRALAHLHELSKQGVDQGADRRAPQSGGEPQTEHHGMAVTDQRTKKGAWRNTKAPKNRNVNG